MSTAATVMDNPTDPIKVAFNNLMHQRSEFLVFSSVDRTARRTHTLVNRRFYDAVLARLTEAERGRPSPLLGIGDTPKKERLFFALQHPSVLRWSTCGTYQSTS